SVLHFLIHGSKPAEPGPRTRPALLPALRPRDSRPAHLRRLRLHYLPDLWHPPRVPRRTRHRIIHGPRQANRTIETSRRSTQPGSRPLAPRFGSAAGQRHHRLFDFPDRQRYRRTASTPNIVLTGLGAGWSHLHVRLLRVR